MLDNLNSSFPGYFIHLRVHYLRSLDINRIYANKKVEHRVMNVNSTNTPLTSALKVVAAYTEALAAGDNQKMEQLRAENFVLDFVTQDAWGFGPLSGEEPRNFWSAWFEGFPEMDFQVTRTIAAEEVVVTQWIFTGTNTGPVPPIIEAQLEPTGKTIRFRGISVYDIADGLLQCETTYIDLGTLLVELGVEL